MPTILHGGITQKITVLFYSDKYETEAVTAQINHHYIWLSNVFLLSNIMLVMFHVLLMHSHFSNYAAYETNTSGISSIFILRTDAVYDCTSLIYMPICQTDRLCGRMVQSNCVVTISSTIMLLNLGFLFANYFVFSFVSNDIQTKWVKWHSLQQRMTQKVRSTVVATLPFQQHRSLAC
jgi:hypothetical protein